MTVTQKSFSIDYTDEEDQRYTGTFTIKRLSIYDTSKVEARLLQLNGGYHYDDEKPGVGPSWNLNYFNRCVAHLETVVLKAPDWWNLDNLTDTGVVFKVYQEVTLFEKSFRRSDKTGQGSGNKESEQPQSSTAATKVVGEEV